MKKNHAVLPLVHNALSTRFGDYLRLLEPELAARLDLSHITLVADKTVAQDLTFVVVAEVPFLAISGHMTFLVMLLTEEPNPQELKRLTEHHLALAERLQKTTHVSVILLKQDHGKLARQTLCLPVGLAALRWIKHSCWRLMGRVLAQSEDSAGRALFQPEDSAALADDICVGFGLLIEDDACRDSLPHSCLAPSPAPLDALRGRRHPRHPSAHVGNPLLREHTNRLLPTAWDLLLPLPPLQVHRHGRSGAPTGGSCEPIPPRTRIRSRR